jgi:hypothetical protein
MTTAKPRPCIDGLFLAEYRDPRGYLPDVRMQSGG